MCTVSILKRGDDVMITMNRDEARERKELNNLRVTNNFCHPVDAQSGGTWIGANAYGLTFALLNRYQDHAVCQPKDIVSRGLIIPELLIAISDEQACCLVDALNMRTFQPFDLLIITHVCITHIIWTGRIVKRITKGLQQPFFLTSSSEYANEVLPYRQNIFEQFEAADHADVLKTVHLQYDESNPRSSIFMCRQTAHTKSITQIMMRCDRTEMLYWPQIALEGDFRTTNALQKAIPYLENKRRIVA